MRWRTVRALGQKPLTFWWWNNGCAWTPWNVSRCSCRVCCPAVYAAYWTSFGGKATEPLAL